MKVPEQVKGQFGPILEKYRQYFLGAGLVFLCLGYYSIGMRPQLAHLSQTGPEIKILNDHLTEAKDNIAKMGFYQSEIKRLEEKLAKSVFKIPAKEEVPMILEGISRLAAQNKIKIDEIMPAKASQEMLQSDKEGKYYSSPIHLEARGAYHDIGRFVDQIEKDPIFKSVLDFNITQNKSDPLHHLFSLTIKSIVLDKAPGP